MLHSPGFSFAKEKLPVAGEGVVIEHSEAWTNAEQNGSEMTTLSRIKDLIVAKNVYYEFARI